MKSTKKSLLLSTLSLVLCFAMLLGTTWAWFTDEVTSGVNQIKAGNLDIEVSYKDASDKWTSIENVGSLFTKNLWEPGHTEFVTLKIENKGTLALKYQMVVTPVSEAGGINKAGAEFKLSDYLVFATTAPSTTEPAAYTRDTARAAAGTGMTLNQAGLTKSGEMQPKSDAQYVTLVVYMPETVGNEANYMTGTAAPEIDLGIKVLATQLMSEKDSFGNDYDKDLSAITPAYNYFPQVAQSAKLTKNGSTITSSTNDSNVIIGENNVTIKSAAKVSEAENATSFAEVIIPAAAVDEGDHIIALNVNKDDNANATFKTQESAPNLTDKETTTYEVNVTKDGVKVSTTDNLYTVKMFIGENKKNLEMYHNNAKMTQKDTPAANNEYNYNPNDGYVTMCVNSFSPFTSVYDEPVAAIGTTVYYTLADAIAKAQNNDTVVLLKNSSGNGIVVPENSKFTVNFNGFTYTVNTNVLAGSNGTKNQCFQLLKGSTLIFKNGAIVADHVGVKMIIQNYCDLTLDNMNIDATKGTNNVSYVVSNNNGTVTIDDTTITAASNGVAFDVYYWPSGSYPDGVTVKLTGNTVINGNVEIGCDNTVKLNSQDNIKANLEVRGTNVVFNNSKITAKRNFSVTSGKATFNNCKLTLANTTYYNTCALWVKNEAEVVWNGGKLTANNSSGFGVHNTAKLTVSNAEITAKDYAVTANGINGGKTINLNGCKITSSESVGVYISGTTSGGQTVNIKGCEIKGATAIEAKHATMTVSDSKLNATANPATYNDNSNGDCTGGYCIASTKNTSEASGSGTITVTNCTYQLAISGGKIAYADTGAKIDGISTGDIAGPKVS